MKNLIVALLCLAVLSGCKKDDQKASGETILGKWTLKKVNYKYFTGSTLIHDNIEDSIYKTNDKYFQFNSDGTGFSNIQEKSIDPFGNALNVSGTFNYTTSNTNLTLIYKISATPLTRSVSFSDDGQFIVHSEINYDNYTDYNHNSTLKQTIDEYFSR